MSIRVFNPYGTILHQLASASLALTITHYNAAGVRIVGTLTGTDNTGNYAITGSCNVKRSAGGAADHYLIYFAP